MASLLTLPLILNSTAVSAGDVYQQPSDFIDEAFGGVTVPSKVIWLSKTLQDSIREIMGHPYPSLRIRYWQNNHKTAWILDEVGKKRPITTGIVINTNKIERLKVLVYRESRGNEIRHPFFTDQFMQIGLQSDLELDRHIDGITGATLSVRAMKKLARVALYLHRIVTNDK